MLERMHSMRRPAADVSDEGSDDDDESKTKKSIPFATRASNYISRNGLIWPCLTLSLILPLITSTAVFYTGSLVCLSSSPATRSRFSFFGFDGLDSDCGALGVPWWISLGIGSWIYYNIGNPQSLGQQPITFFREVLALTDLATCWTKLKLGHCSVLTQLKELSKSLIKFREEQGVKGLRDAIAAGIEARDGFPCTSDDIFLTDGASPGGSSEAKNLNSDEESTGESDVLIECRDIYKSFGEKQILRGVSFKIRHGEAIGIIGPSGTGKSTVLKIMAGLLAPDKGEVYIRVKKRQGLISDEELSGLRIGLVFQSAALFDSLTVRENVGFLLYEHSSMPEDQIEALVTETLAAVGLKGVESLKRLLGDAEC